MSLPAVLQLFGPEHPIEAGALVDNLNLLIDGANRLGRDTRYAKATFAPTLVFDWALFQVVNTLVCDGLTVGGVPVVASDQVATRTVLGAVLGAHAATLAPLTGVAAEQVATIGAAVNRLLKDLREAGVIAR